MHAQRMPPHITTPFDDSAAVRLRRMGLLTPNGTPDERIIQPLAYVSAGLYYDQLCDSVESHESAAGVCQHIISEEAENRPRQALLALSMSYDAMCRGLPDPIWWLSGSKDMGLAEAYPTGIKGGSGSLWVLCPFAGQVSDRVAESGLHVISSQSSSSSFDGGMCSVSAILNSVSNEIPRTVPVPSTCARKLTLFPILSANVSCV